MKKTLLQNNIFLAVALAFVFTAFPAVTSAQWTDYGSTYDTWTDYGSTYDTWTDYGSTYDNWTNYGSTYDDWTNYGSTYDTWTDYGSTYDTWTDYGSTYDNWTDYGSTYDTWTDYGSTYDNWTNYGSTYDDWTNYGSTYDTWTDYGSTYDNWTDYGSTYDDPYYPNNGYSYPVSQPYYGGGYNDPYYYQYPYYGGWYDYSGGWYDYSGGWYDDCYTDCYNYQPPAPCRNCGGDNPPRYDDLEVECRANPRNAEEGERITWTATADGGNGNYTYSWSEDVSGNARTEYETYNREGTYYGSVRVRSSDGQSATARCSVRVDEEDEDDDLDVRCEYTPNRPDEDDRVTFRAIVDGGDGDYDYDWSGDVNGDDRTVTKRFTREGRYEAEITVRDGDGNRASDTCDFRIGDNDDDTNVNLVSTPSLPNPTGTPASLSAVYLSQVPYTGPEDAIKFSLWGIALALFSIVSVREYKKYTYNKLKKNRIEAFKEENKARLSA